MAQHAELAAQHPMMAMQAGMPDMLHALVLRLSAWGDAAAAMLADAAQAPGRLGQAAGLLTDHGASGTLARVLADAGAALAIALLLALLARRLVAPLRRRLARARPRSTEAIALRIAEGGAVDLLAPVVYLVVSLLLEMVLFGARGWLFTGSGVFHMVFSALVVNSAIAWALVHVLSIPSAPGRPGLRLVPLDDAEAAEIGRVLRIAVAFAGGSWILAESLYLLWFGDGVPRIILIVAAFVVASATLINLLRRRHLFRGLRRIWHRLAIIAVFGNLFTWIDGLLLDSDPRIGRVIGTFAILAAMLLVDGMSQLGFNRLRRRLARAKLPARVIYVPREGDDQEEELRAVEQPLRGAELIAARTDVAAALDAFIGVLHDASYILLAVLAVILLAADWSVHLRAFLVVGGVRTWLGAALDATATLVVGWYAWRLFETALAWRLSREEGGLQSRARTVQPLLRSVGKAVIGAVALMGTLSELGLNIAPLLASAGVVGIAVGFGAQTLVKDLFSGASYLVEDVFRIGDYIEAGSAKGTVEKITFRTVALRHQNGPLHFVPYGSLGSVRNNSRDWVIDKFEIPLPIDVSSEAIRKMVKKIGQEMLTDPDLGRIITAPLKAKLYRIQPGAKIFRCKVQTPPGLQFEVRSEAYRRIEAALAEAGISFAESGPQVTINNAAPALALTVADEVATPSPVHAAE